MTYAIYDKLAHDLGHTIKAAVDNDGVGPDLVFAALMCCVCDALSNLEPEDRQEYVDKTVAALPKILAKVNQLDDLAVH
jgi:hypothetical protein